MGTFTVRKVQDNGNEGFNETIEYHVMHQANVNSNHNKYYCEEIQKHPDGRYRIFTHYGRLGISNIYEVRDLISGQPCRDYSTAKKEFDSIHKKKLSGKSVKDPDTGETVKESYVDIEVVSPQVGSVNIRGATVKTSSVTSKKTAIDTSCYTDKRVSSIIDQLIDENIHSITGHSSITYSVNGGFQTGLGPVTPEHIARARVPLDELNKLMGASGNVDPSDRKVQQLNSMYFSLIPKPFSRKIADSDMVLDANQLQNEYDILDQLYTSVTMGSALSGNTTAKINALGTDLEFLEDIDEIKRIKKHIRDSKASNHRSTDVWAYDVKAIFKIRIPTERARYEGSLKKYGNVREVIHGSSTSNCLSILKGGLIIPPTKAGHVTGRLNGDAIYGAIQSTKALNYSIGFWGGRRNSYNNAFLFLVDFAMGRTFETNSSTPGGAPKGYDSVWAKPGYLHNHELMVYKVEQATIKYVIEMSK